MCHEEKFMSRRPKQPNMCGLGLPWRAFLKYLCRQGFEFWMIGAANDQGGHRLKITIHLTYSFFTSSFLPPFLLMRIWERRWNLEKWMTTLFIPLSIPNTVCPPLLIIRGCCMTVCPTAFPSWAVSPAEAALKIYLWTIGRLSYATTTSVFHPNFYCQKGFWCLDRKHIESSWQSKMCSEAEDKMPCPMNS